MYPFVAKVRYFNEYSVNNDGVYDETSCNQLLYADNFTDAMHQIEVNFADSLIAASLECVADEYTCFEIPDAMVDAFILGEGDYETGLRRIKEDY